MDELGAEIDTGHEHTFERLRLAYDAGDVTALLDALIFCQKSSKTPSWVVSEAFSLIAQSLVGTTEKVSGPHSNQVTKLKDRLTHFARWMTVDLLHIKRGSYLKNAKYEAATLLSGTPFEASPSTIEESYRALRKRSGSLDPRVFRVPSTETLTALGLSSVAEALELNVNLGQPTSHIIKPK